LQVYVKLDKKMKFYPFLPCVKQFVSHICDTTGEVHPTICHEGTEDD